MKGDIELRAVQVILFALFVAAFVGRFKPLGFWHGL